MKHLLLLAAIFGLQSCQFDFPIGGLEEAKERCKLNDGVKKILYGSDIGYTVTCKNGATFQLTARN